MPKSLSASLILAFSLLARPGIAHACDTQEAATPASTCVVLPFREREGVWLELQTAEKLRSEHVLVPELRLQIAKRDELEAEQAAEIKDLRGAIEVRTQIASSLTKSIELAAKDAREARDEAASARAELHAWYRSPFLWTAAGVLIGGISIALALH